MSESQDQDSDAKTAVSNSTEPHDDWKLFLRGLRSSMDVNRKSVIVSQGVDRTGMSTSQLFEKKFGEDIEEDGRENTD